MSTGQFLFDNGASGLLGNEGADFRGDFQNLKYTDSSAVACIKAVCAALATVENMLMLRAESKASYFLVCRLIALFTLGADPADQSLGNNGAESSGNQVRLNADILQTFDRSHSIVGMDCGKHNVSGNCGTHTDLGGFTVSNLSDGNDIRVLTKDGTKTIGKIHACFLIDLHLIYSVDIVLDRILQGYYIDFLCI